MKVCTEPHTHVLKWLRLKDIPPSPPKIAFWNWKTIRDKLVTYKLRDFINDDEGVDICDCSNYNICNILENKNCLRVLLQSKNITLIFHLIVIALVWYISWNISMPEKVCFESTITKLRLHREGKCGFKQEKLTVHFFGM